MPYVSENAQAPSPMLSVLMTVYNNEHYIEEAINGLLNQTFTDFELLIFNDASSDRSKDLMEQYQDPRIQRFDSQENVGVARGLNFLLDKARGKYIGRADGDDLYHPQLWERKIAYMEAHPEIDVLGNAMSFLIEAQNNRVSPHTPLPRLHESISFVQPLANCLPHPSIVIRHQFLRKSGVRYNPQFKYEDYRLWQEALNAGAHFHNLSEVLFLYRRPMQATAVTTASKDPSQALWEHSTITKEGLSQAPYTLTDAQIQSLSRIKAEIWGESLLKDYKQWILILNSWPKSLPQFQGSDKKDWYRALNFATKALLEHPLYLSLYETRFAHFFPMLWTVLRYHKLGWNPQSLFILFAKCTYLTLKKILSIPRKLLYLARRSLKSLKTEPKALDYPKIKARLKKAPEPFYTPSVTYPTSFKKRP